MKQKRKQQFPLLARSILFLAISTTLLFWISTSSVDPSPERLLLSAAHAHDLAGSGEPPPSVSEQNPKEEAPSLSEVGGDRRRSCATVEEMGEAFAAGSEKESLRVREVIRRHFDLNGAARVRGLPPQHFCQQGFVIGIASEAGFGNEMYKILTAAALSVMLNRSLIIGQTRGLYPFGDYISYTNLSFTLKEVKHLWRKNDCVRRHGRNLIARIDNFKNAAKTNVLCSDWMVWKQPIIWFQGTTDAVGIQFFLKNIHPRMRDAASILFGQPESLQSRPNAFGELMRVVISPSQAIREIVDGVLKGSYPDVALHMRMLTNRSVRAIKAALNCIRRSLLRNQQHIVRPRVVLVSDTPSFIKEITPNLTKFADVSRSTSYCSSF